MKKDIMKDMELSKEFFYDEVRDGFYIPSIVKRLWGAELRILSEIDGISTRHQIPYYVAAGTLPGAVLSGEFIPWYLFKNICKYHYSAFEEIKRIPFCGGTVPAPIGHEEVLRAEYGLLCDGSENISCGLDYSSV